jgi:hypothetical protein
VISAVGGALVATITGMFTLGAAAMAGQVHVGSDDGAIIERIDQLEQRLIERDRRIFDLQDDVGRVRTKLQADRSRIAGLEERICSYHASETGCAGR